MIAIAFIVGGIVMLIVERFRPGPDVFDVDDMPIGRALAHRRAVRRWRSFPACRDRAGRSSAAWSCGLDRPAAAEFSFFLAMPTMAAAFATRSARGARHDLGSARGLEIAVGFVMAFVASALVVKPFLNFVRRSGFAPFAWYRIALRRRRARGDRRAGWM